MLKSFKKKERVDLHLHDLLIRMARVKKNTDYIQAVSLTLVDHTVKFKSVKFSLSTSRRYKRCLCTYLLINKLCTRWN